MSESTQDSSAAYATALLVHYGFEIRGYTAEEFVQAWLASYQAIWVRLAVIEALYQGRYKAVSVEQILATWKRRGRPMYHFNHDFERLIGRKFPQSMTASPDTPSVTDSTKFSLTTVESVTATVAEDVGGGGMALLGYQKVSPAVTTLTVEGTETPIEPVEVEPSQPGDTSRQASVVAQASETGMSKNNIYQADWLRWEVRKQPINQFKPSTDVSTFYLKLKAVADRG